MNHHQHPKVQKTKTQRRLLLFWLLLGVYVVSFMTFAAFDLYAEHTTQGLFNTHRTPFLHKYGNVIDPKPMQRLNQEVGARLKVEPSTLPPDWFTETAMDSTYIKSHSIRLPGHNEILLGRSRDGRLLLVLGEYLGEWVTFRPSLGVIIEPVNPLIDIQAGLILGVPTP